MKIFFRISTLGFGGAEQVFLSVARVLQKKHGVEIFFIVDNMVGKNITVAQDAGFSVLSLNASRTLTSIIPFAKLIKLQRPDVIISAYTDTNAACLLSELLSNCDTPIIVSEHASLKEHWQSKSTLKKKILKFYVGWVYKLANKVICVSKGLENQVNTILQQPEKTITIYNPVRFNQVSNENKIAHDKLNLVAVGRVAEPKDYCTLIQAIAEIKKHRDVQLKIVGGTYQINEFNKVTEEVKLYGLESTIEFVGYTDSVSEYYQKADIFVLSSAWEGFGNVIVEAMAFGLPIVSTNCNYGPAEILDNGRYGRLVEVGDPTALATAICEEANNPLVGTDILVKRSTYFSESKIAAEYYQLILETIK